MAYSGPFVGAVNIRQRSCSPEIGAIVAIIDRATYEAPTQLSEGIVHVFVNGSLSWTQSSATSARNGHFLRRATPT